MASNQSRIISVKNIDNEIIQISSDSEKSDSDNGQNFLDQTILLHSDDSDDSNTGNEAKPNMFTKIYTSQTRAAIYHSNTLELLSSEDTDTEVKNTGSSPGKRLKTNIDPMDEPAIPPKLTRQFAGIYAKQIIISTEDAGTYQDQQNLEAYIDTSSQEQKNLKVNVGTMTSKPEIPPLLGDSFGQCVLREYKAKNEDWLANIFTIPSKKLGPDSYIEGEKEKLSNAPKQ